MSILLEIDKSQRKIISILFRILIVIYSVFLLIYINSKFNFWINALFFILYVTIYFLLLKKNRLLSIIRLINDYLFIGFIMYQTNVFNIFTFSLLFAPILNTHNHSGDKKCCILYILPVLILTYIEKSFLWWYIIPFLFLCLINSFDNLRSKYFNFQQKLNAVVDNFFIDDRMNQRPYKIYSKVIPIINSTSVIKNISDIICLRVENKNLFVVNGSSFVWNIDLDKVKFFKSIKKSKILYNFPFNINGVDINFNLVNTYVVNDIHYCFIFIPSKKESFNIFPYYFIVSKLLNPFFNRLTKVFHSDLRQKKNNLLKLKELENKFNYVSNSIKSMHFIKNKLGPIKNYLAMVDDYNRTDDIAKKDMIKPFLLEEQKKLVNSINEIVKRAEYILRKSNNPFNVFDTRTFGTQMFFANIRSIWSFYFREENFNFGWNTNKERVKYDIMYNKNGIDFVLDNWISNMKKYNKGTYGVNFIEENNFYVVEFFNNIDVSNKAFIDDYSLDDRVEIIKRSSNGLFEIKTFLEQMKINNTMTFKKPNIVLFRLEFIKYKYDENINN